MSKKGSEFFHTLSGWLDISVAFGEPGFMPFFALFFNLK
jgi:hypothetical protein